jgi:hypothetical protein
MAVVCASLGVMYVSAVTATVYNNLTLFPYEARMVEVLLLPVFVNFYPQL